MTSYDGTELAGDLLCVERPKRVILAMHGWRSCWARDFGPVADFFRDNDCTVLYAQQRGQGESGGEYMGFGMIERFDCLEWVKWLNANGFGGSRIYLAGISMGATTVLMTAGFPELPENVAGVLADCGFTSAKAEWKYISENNLRVPYDRRCKHVDALCRKRIELTPDAYTTLDAMKTCRVPILFVHGKLDPTVPFYMGQELYEHYQGEKDCLFTDDARHIETMYLHPREYMEKIDAFIERYIKYYNEKRIKEKLGWMSPVQYRINALVA